MEPEPWADASSLRRHRRQDRQRAEILGLLTAGELARAADLTHEHLAEFPDDDVRMTVVSALRASADARLRRRAHDLFGP